MKVATGRAITLTSLDTSLNRRGAVITYQPPNKRMQPTHQPVIKFACANLSPIWRAADARSLDAKETS